MTMKRKDVLPMSTEPRTTRAARSRVPTRHELTQFYRAIGIPAVASALQAAKMTPQKSPRTGELPAFLRDAHAAG